MPVDDEVAGWPTLEGIPWAEVVDSSPEEELRNDGSRAVRTFLTPWETRSEFAYKVLGYPSEQVLGTKSYLSRVIPLAHPDYTDSEGGTFLWATQIMRCEPYGLPDAAGGVVNMRSGFDVAKYGFARMQVLYESVPYTVLADSECTPSGDGPDESLLERYFTVEGMPAGEYLPVPAGSLAYVDGVNPANVVQGQPNKKRPKTDITLTWWLVPTRMIGLRFVNPEGVGLGEGTLWPINACQGTVNASTFLGCRKGTLLFETACPRRVISAFGDVLWNVDFRFVHLDLGDDDNGVPIGFNHLLKFDASAVTTEYYEIVAKPDSGEASSNATLQTDGKSYYDWSNFSVMFPPFE